MYFWNVKQLTEDLKEGKVSQKEKFKYFFVFMLLSSFVSEFAVLIDEINRFSVIEGLTVIFITMLGVVFCYRINVKGDNKEYIDRFICLSFPNIHTIVCSGHNYSNYNGAFGSDRSSNRFSGYCSFRCFILCMDD